jgi:hypothetical protein
VDRGTIWAIGAAAGRSLQVLLAVVVTVCGVASLAGSGRASAAAVPLRQVDWLAVLENDPAVTVDPDAFKLPGGSWPFVTVAAPRTPDGTLGGYALIDDVGYGDLDGDGAEEAIVMIDSGGTGGMLGFLLYHEAEPRPKLVLVRAGYKMSVVIDGGRVVIHEPNYVGFEANCCPSSLTRTLNALEGDRLVTLATEVEPNDVQEPTVWSFYRALSDRRYEDAYAFLSPEQQARNPFAQWRAGYANTESIEVETRPGRTPSEVLIELTGTDRRPGGGTVRWRYTGSWTLIWSDEQRRWLLDKATIQPG